MPDSEVDAIKRAVAALRRVLATTGPEIADTDDDAAERAGSGLSVASGGTAMPPTLGERND